MQTRIDIQPISFDVLKEKYCKGNETTEDEIFERVACCWDKTYSFPFDIFLGKILK
jgi:hypothetical protein